MSDETGIWVKLILDDGTVVTGFAAGADSPNDFWTTFKTQLVRLNDVHVTRPQHDTRDYPTLHVNRDKIVLVDTASGDVAGTA